MRQLLWVIWPSNTFPSDTFCLRYDLSADMFCRRYLTLKIIKDFLDIISHFLWSAIILSADTFCRQYVLLSIHFVCCYVLSADTFCILWFVCWYVWSPIRFVADTFCRGYVLGQICFAPILLSPVRFVHVPIISLVLVSSKQSCCFLMLRFCLKRVFIYIFI